MYISFKDVSIEDGPFGTMRIIIIITVILAIVVIVVIVILVIIIIRPTTSTWSVPHLIPSKRIDTKHYTIHGIYQHFHHPPPPPPQQHHIRIIIGGHTVPYNIGRPYSIVTSYNNNIFHITHQRPKTWPIERYKSYSRIRMPRRYYSNILITTTIATIPNTNILVRWWTLPRTR